MADTPTRTLHCWEAGPTDDDEVSSTCMLPLGHDGTHEYTRDDQIRVRLAPFEVEVDSAK